MKSYQGRGILCWCLNAFAFSHPVIRSCKEIAMPEASCGEGSIYICTGDEGGSMRDFYSTRRISRYDTLPPFWLPNSPYP